MTIIFSYDSFMCITLNENISISYRILNMYVKFEAYFQKLINDNSALVEVVV